MARPLASEVTAHCRFQNSTGTSVQRDRLSLCVMHSGTIEALIWQDLLMYWLCNKAEFC